MLTIILDAMAAHLGPDYDPASGADFDTIRRHLDALEMATADRLPPVTVADLKDDREIRRACEGWRERRYGSPVDVTDLKEDDGGDTWTIIRGANRYEVREVAGRDFDPVRFDTDENGAADGVYAVVDTDTGETVSEDGTDHVPVYDCTDEAAAWEAARLANVAHYQENAYGWPFAHNYAWEIDERYADDFDKAGFVVATHEPSGRVYAGIDGGGYSFLDQHWLPLYLAHLTSRYGPEHVRTDQGLRRLAR